MGGWAHPYFWVDTHMIRHENLQLANARSSSIPAMTIAVVSSNGLWLGSSVKHRWCVVGKYMLEQPGIIGILLRWSLESGQIWCFHMFSFMFNVWLCDNGGDMKRYVHVYTIYMCIYIYMMYICDIQEGHCFFKDSDSREFRAVTCGWCQAEEFDQLVRCLLDAKEATEPRQTAMMLLF